MTSLLIIISLSLLFNNFKKGFLFSLSFGCSEKYKSSILSFINSFLSFSEGVTISFPLFLLCKLNFSLSKLFLFIKFKIYSSLISIGGIFNISALSIELLFKAGSFFTISAFNLLKDSWNSLEHTRLLNDGFNL